MSTVFVSFGACMQTLLVNISEKARLQKGVSVPCWTIYGVFQFDETETWGSSNRCWRYSEVAILLLTTSKASAHHQTATLC